HRWACNLRHLLSSVALEASRPQTAGFPVAEDVGSAQFGKLLPTVDAPAGDATRDRMRQLDQRRTDRIRSHLLRFDGLRSFHGRPSVVATLLDPMNRLPKLPADIADEQFAGLMVEAHPPGVAEAIGPHFRPRSLHLDERIIRRNGVVFSPLLMVHIDPQDGGEKIGDVLPRVERIRRVRVPSIARGNVEHAVGAEVEVASVVPTLKEGKDDLFARRIDAWRVRLTDGEARDARSVRQVLLVGLIASQGVTEKALAILLEIGMKC